MRHYPDRSPRQHERNNFGVTGLRVLIVDDEEMVRNGLAIWLTARQFVVFVASDLQSAVSAAIEHMPDVVLLDVKLGSEDGLQLVKLLQDRGLRLPVVVLTAHAGPYDGFKAHEVGVVSLIEKPSSPDEVAGALRRAAASRRNDQSSDFVATSDPSGVRSCHVSQAIRVIQATFKTKGLSLEVIARSVDVSHGHLSKVFRREMRCSVVAYIHRLRVEHASHLLRTTTMSVKVIADVCGYHGSSELHRNFSRQLGISPLGYRSRESARMTSLDNVSPE